eukprot:gene11714-8503_t
MPVIDDVLHQIRRNQAHTRRVCSDCDRLLPQNQFGPRMFRGGDDGRLCIGCAKAADGRTKTKKCMRCVASKALSEFAEWELRKGEKRLCKECQPAAAKEKAEEVRQAAAAKAKSATLKCHARGGDKAKADFTGYELRRGDERTCRGCKGCKGLPCSKCKKTKKREDFNTFELTRGPLKRCRDCTGPETERACAKCHVVKKKKCFAEHQWRQGADARCHVCCPLGGNKDLPAGRR